MTDPDNADSGADNKKDDDGWDLLDPDTTPEVGSGGGQLHYRDSEFIGLDYPFDR